MSLVKYPSFYGRGLTLVAPVDLFLEQNSVQDSQGGTEQFLVSGKLGAMIGGRIVFLSVGS